MIDMGCDEKYMRIAVLASVKSEFTELLRLQNAADGVISI